MMKVTSKMRGFSVLMVAFATYQCLVAFDLDDGLYVEEVGERADFISIDPEEAAYESLQGNFIFLGTGL